MTSRPRYSFVATSRNDDHGGDILRRTQSWVTRLAEQCERHEVPCELVLVDWNPPKSRAPLSDVLAWPRGSEWFSARVLVVPPKLHRELRYSGRLPMFQMIAKNVGIRRALGEFIIATNVDIIFSDEMFCWLKTDEAKEGRLYRSDRWDIPNEIQLERDIDGLLRRAREEAIRRNLRDGTYVRRDGCFVNTTQTQFDFSFYNPLKHKIDDLQYLIEGGSPDLAEIALKLREILTTMPQLRDNFFIPLLHTNGCGDFTMLSRFDWFALRGYPEWNIFSWAIDSILIFQAHFNGIKIEELPAHVTHYHIEHDYGSGWTPEGSSNLWARLDQRGITYISYDDFTEITKELQGNASEGRFTLYNELSWGFFDRAIDCCPFVGPDTLPRPPLRSNAGPIEETVDLTVIANLPLERSFCRGDQDVRSQIRESEDGSREIVVETSSSQWSYSLTFDLSIANTLAPDYWIKTEVCVDSGTIFIGILNREGNDFLAQAECRGPSKKYQEVMIFVKNTLLVSEVIFRNGNSDGRSARFRVRSITILHETGAATGDERVAVSTLVAAVLADIRPGSPESMVRLLRNRSPAADGVEADGQAMIILPPAGGPAGAILDLGAPSQRVDKVFTRLHVIEGEVVIGVQTRTTGETVVECRETPGDPLKQVDLEADAAAHIGRLVINNASQSHPAKLLLHHVAYRTVAPEA
jgi:hypothetical protein